MFNVIEGNNGLINEYIGGANLLPLSTSSKHTADDFQESQKVIWVFIDGKHSPVNSISYFFIC